MAPAATSLCTTAGCARLVCKGGQAAVLGRPARSMLSFTAKGMPYSAAPLDRMRQAARARLQRGLVQTRDPDGLSACPSMRASTFLHHLPGLQAARE